jgi:hypothetical protein
MGVSPHCLNDNACMQIYFIFIDVYCRWDIGTKSFLLEDSASKSRKFAHTLHCFTASRPAVTTRDLIEKDLMEIDEEVQLNSIKLHRTSDVHKGMEILHLFLIDVIGRYLSPFCRIIYFLLLRRTYFQTPIIIILHFCIALLMEWCGDGIVCRKSPAAKIFDAKIDEE